MRKRNQATVSTNFVRIMVICTIMAADTLAQSAHETETTPINNQPDLKSSHAKNSHPELEWQQIVELLKLEGHVEGGFFRRTSEATQREKIGTPYGQRLTMTSIYYLLTIQSPIGHFHLNRSDINHFFHLGDAITYYLIFPDGHLETHVLGSNLLAGEVMQLNVAGGVWKASKVTPNDTQYGFSLIGEAVSPGFEYEDMTIGVKKQMLDQFPQHSSLISELSYQSLPTKPM